MRKEPYDSGLYNAANTQKCFNNKILVENPDHSSAGMAIPITPEVFLHNFHGLSQQSHSYRVTCPFSSKIWLTRKEKKKKQEEMGPDKLSNHVNEV